MYSIVRLFELQGFESCTGIYYVQKISKVYKVNSSFEGMGRKPITRGRPPKITNLTPALLQWQTKEIITLLQVIPTMAFQVIRGFRIRSGILSDILSHILSGILSDISFDIVCYILHSQLISCSAHWDLALAVEVRQCPLRFGARG